MVSYASSSSSTSISSRRSSKSSMALLMTQNNELKMRDENNNKRISDLENKQNQLFAWFFQRFQPQPPYSPGTQQSGHSQPPQQSGQSQPPPAYPYIGHNQQPPYPVYPMPAQPMPYMQQPPMPYMQQPPYQVPVYRPEMAAPSGSFPEVPVGGFSGMLAGVGFDVDLSRIFGSDGGSQGGGSQGEGSQAEGSGRRSGADSVG
ncbi:eukaryotic translation initiation factor 4 gamma-like [Pyrus x bretschneideri]|uniref:eukaryotic translation initiation factor 4 gamma-like n=1 Tax=Pyrus x bretschneideri TaxID=225117 RepID=UPI0020308457|nr:eukaryotic translation initiation factor 4 gamma-like [Pyrus x bretschneideri]